jgi:hypothetical protein
MRSDCRGVIRSCETCRSLLSSAALLSDILFHPFFLWRFGCDHLVGSADQGFEFIGGQHIWVGESDPLVASDVGRWRDAFDFQQFVKFIWRAFKREARESAVGEGHPGEDFSADFEAEIFGPRHVFGHIGEGEAELANPFDVGHGGDDSAETKGS